MNEEIQKYNSEQTTPYGQICDKLEQIISENLVESESKVWHRHPVWFIKGNPIVGYSKQKKGLRLMFWSGADFEEPELIITHGKFRDASFYYNAVEEIDKDLLIRWLDKSVKIQWDYKNIIKRKGQLVRL